MHILLTNDDSHRSPLLQFIIDALLPVCELTIVVPKHEQSWRGKAMNRYESLHVEPLKIEGCELAVDTAFTVDGTPADCVNIGIHNLCKSKPDLVVSGINAGLNTGSAFAFCSGTLGACFEANIAGVPGLALSQEFDSAVRNAYAAEYVLEHVVRTKLEIQTKLVLDRILPKFLSLKPFARPITWSVNLPYNLKDNQIKPKVCRLGHTRYGSCYRLEESRYVHQLMNIDADQNPDSDTYNITHGIVSMTAIDINALGQQQNEAELVALLES